MLGRKTGGRVKGTPNKLTRKGREAFERAFRSIGGTKALAEWARENRTKGSRSPFKGASPMETRAPGERANNLPRGPSNRSMALALDSLKWSANSAS